MPVLKPFTGRARRPAPRMIWLFSRWLANAPGWVPFADARDIGRLAWPVDGVYAQINYTFTQVGDATEALWRWLAACW